MAERRPGWSLPQQMYLSPQAFERDMARVFMRGWSFVGHIARIPAVGDYFLHEIGDESIVVMRSGGEDTAVCSRPGGLLRAQRLRPVQHGRQRVSLVSGVVGGGKRGPPAQHAHRSGRPHQPRIARRLVHVERGDAALRLPARRSARPAARLPGNATGSVDEKKPLWSKSSAGRASNHLLASYAMEEICRRDRPASRWSSTSRPGKTPFHAALSSGAELP